MKKSTLAAVVLVAMTAGFASSWYVAANRAVELEAATFFGEQARALPGFELTDHRGAPLTPAGLEGHWSLLFFGFTNCPGVCPTTLQTLAEMNAALDDPDVAEALRVYFVSVDHVRDAPQNLRDYVTYFDPEFVGASGDEDNLRRLTRALGIAFELQRASPDDADYNVEHGMAIVLINPRAEYAGVFSPPHRADSMARDMTRIVERWN